jgi:hypothetical protein
MAPANRADAALKYVDENSFLSPAEVNEYRSMIDNASSDEELKAYESALWASTSVGAGKAAWMELMNSMKAGERTRKR